MLNTVKQLRQKVREINERYSKPHIEMSGAVRLSLLALRVYLLFLVGLMIYKFITLVN
ncbi:MAG TPA: hypothetical protein VMC81_02905 [Rhodocyclaceae bacterium]|nr:hypothetical protein [Rhodocyclaceae bacterium]